MPKCEFPRQAGSDALPVIKGDIRKLGGKFDSIKETLDEIAEGAARIEAAVKAYLESKGL